MPTKRRALRHDRIGEIAVTTHKAMPRSAFASHLCVIAAAAATALLCLAVPAEAGCSKSVIIYNASWCPYCRQVRAILARNHIRYSVLDATTLQVLAILPFRAP